MREISEKHESTGKRSASAANITDQERDWAELALAEYEQKNYKACLEHLRKIEEARPNDSKVLLNKAIVEFYENDLCTTDKFQKSFVDVCKQVRYTPIQFTRLFRNYCLINIVTVYRLI